MHLEGYTPKLRELKAEFGTKYSDFDKLLDGLNYRFKTTK